MSHGKLLHKEFSFFISEVKQKEGHLLLTCTKSGFISSNNFLNLPLDEKN